MDNINYFLNVVGTDINNIINELNKLMIFKMDEKNISNNDIDKLTRYLSGSTGLDNQARKNADVNGDGVINNTDLTLLQNKINNSTSSPIYASTTPITS